VLRLSPQGRACLSIRYVEHLEGDGLLIFEHASALGCEGIVSKRLGSRYLSGR
jgi:bifunctional non-homologous end joining protein LigD